MNKQEAIEKLNEIEKEQAKLRAILEAPESNQWKPEKGETMYSINLSGKSYPVTYLGIDLQDKRLDIGNCFKTREEADNSLKKVIMSSEYDYWIPGVSPCKPSFQPKNAEHYYDGWHAASHHPKYWQYDVYRWKRSEQ